MKPQRKIIGLMLGVVTILFTMFMFSFAYTSIALNENIGTFISAFAGESVNTYVVNVVTNVVTGIIMLIFAWIAPHIIIIIITSKKRNITPVRSFSPYTPPLHAQYLLWFLPIPRKDREIVIGDLDEQHYELWQRFGQKRADRWYYLQVAASFWPFLKAKITWLIGKSIKWGIVGWIISALRLGWEYVRRFV